MTSVRYTPGSTLTVVATDAILMLATPVAFQQVDELLEVAREATSAREILVALSGGHLIDLDNLPEFAFAVRRDGALRIALRGQFHGVVTNDDTSIDIDGTGVALVGEWSYPAYCSLELSSLTTNQSSSATPRAADLAPVIDGDLPLGTGVVLADSVSCVPETGDAPPSSLTPGSDNRSAAPPARTRAPLQSTPPAAREHRPAASSGTPAAPTRSTSGDATIAPEPSSTISPKTTPKADHTAIPECNNDGPTSTDEPVTPPDVQDRPAPTSSAKTSAVPSTANSDVKAPNSQTNANLTTGSNNTTSPEQPPHQTGASESGVVGSVEYTSGGGIDYGRLLGGNANTAKNEPPTAHTPHTNTTPTGRSGETGAQAESVDDDTPDSDAHHTSSGWSAFKVTDTSGPESPAQSLSQSSSWGSVDRSDETVPPGTYGSPSAPIGSGADAKKSPAGQSGEPEDSQRSTTPARLCPQNHANPPHLNTCRICSAPLDGPAVRVARPTLGSVRLSTGMFFDLDRPLLFGRAPRVDAVDIGEAPRLVVLDSPSQTISRNHLRIDIDGWSVLAVDNGGKNGTYLRRGAAEEIRLMPGEPKMLMSGDVLLVDDVDIRFEDLP